MSPGTTAGASGPVRDGRPVMERLRGALHALGPLPVLDDSVRRVIALADDPEASNAEIAAAIERDASFAGNLLRAADRARAGRTGGPAGVSGALMLVGRNGLRRVASEATTYGLLERVGDGGPESRAELHAHAVAVAGHAAALAERAGVDADAAHLAGLLHDIGKALLPMIFGAAPVNAAYASSPRGLARLDAERRALGIDHAVAGAALAAGWKLDPAIITAIRRHHGPEPGDGISACVQAANELALLSGGGAGGDTGLLAGALSALGLDASALGDVVHAAGAGAVAGPARQRLRELERSARLDDLTGLAARGHWDAEVGAALARGEAGILLLADADDFKGVNDSYGHGVGDQALVAIARTLERVGFAGRRGGDEFAVWIAPEPDGALEQAQRVCDDVARLRLPGAGELMLGVSVGVARAPADGRDLATLLEAADAALYASKRTGRARASAAGPSGARAAGERGAGAALSAVLDAHLDAVRVAERARLPAEGARALVAAEEAIARLCSRQRTVAFMLDHALSPALLSHGFQTIALAGVSACRLGWDDERIVGLVVGALFADIGMTRLERGLTEKPGRLTGDERAELARHPALGAALLAGLGEGWPLAAPVAAQHHERWDGGGYPAGLAGTQISAEAQLVAVCHRYLAAVQSRPHRPAIAPHRALELLYTQAGTLAEHHILEAFATAVAVYPVGSFVLLSNGLSGEVTGGGTGSRPHVRALWDPRGEPLEEPELIDLVAARTLYVDCLGG